MTSTHIADTLLRELNYVGAAAPGHGAATATPTGFTFELDFDSSLRWPDLPFDTASSRSHYPAKSRPLIMQTLATSEHIFRTRAPRAWAFISEHLDTAMIRQSQAIDGASSSSNRDLVGTCLLTNLHLSPDRVPICIEALVHETIHQFLYRIELRDGTFCDLGDPGRYRSPWSGNRIPLHSLIHASFVWFGLLTLWCQLAQSSTDTGEASSLRGRVAPTLFGFTFISETLDARSFPRSGVQSQILDMIRHMSGIATAVARSADRYPTLREGLRSSEEGAWVPLLRSGIDRCAGSWHAPDRVATGPDFNGRQPAAEVAARHQVS